MNLKCKRYIKTIKKVLKNRFRFFYGTILKNFGIATLFQLRITVKRVLMREKIFVKNILQ